MPLYTPVSTATAGQYPATATNDDAGAGKVGEYVASVISSGAAVALTTNTQTNITSISLTAGDWDVEGLINFAGGATTNIGVVQASTSTTSATLGGGGGLINNKFLNQAPFGNTATVTFEIPRMRFSLASTTTIYFVVNAFFTVSTLSAYGTFKARRVR